MRRIVFALTLIVVTAVLFFPFYKVVDDGLWPVSVTIRSTSGLAIQSVSGEAFGDAGSAEYALQNLSAPETFIDSATQDPYLGEKLAVPVPTSERTNRSLVWNYRSFYQFKTLVVIVQYANGRREGRMVEIPDLRQKRDIVVEFP
jgi:hypothetical protein